MKIEFYERLSKWRTLCRTKKDTKHFVKWVRKQLFDSAMGGRGPEKICLNAESSSCPLEGYSYEYIDSVMEKYFSEHWGNEAFDILAKDPSQTDLAKWHRHDYYVTFAKRTPMEYK